MFRLVNYDDEGAGELFRYLSETASKVIWNALNIWGGSIPAILDIYLTEFAGLPIGEADADFFDGISRYISTDIVRQDIKAMTDRLKMKGFDISADGRIGMEILVGTKAAFEAVKEAASERIAKAMDEMESDGHGHQGSN